MRFRERDKKNKGQKISPEEAQEAAIAVFEQARNLGLLRPEAERRFTLEIARLKAQAFREFAVFPHWVQQWQLQYAHAAFEETQHTFDFRRRGLGCVQLSMRLIREDDDPSGALRVSWESDTFHEQGWWLAIFLHKAQESACLTKLAGERRGFDLFLTQQELGFDPATSPFQFVVYPG